MEVYHGKIYTFVVVVMLPPVFSLLQGQIYFGGNLVCALQATFLDGFLSKFSQMCIIVKSTHL